MPSLSSVCLASSHILYRFLVQKYDYAPNEVKEFQRGQQVQEIQFTITFYDPQLNEELAQLQERIRG